MKYKIYYRKEPMFCPSGSRGVPLLTLDDLPKTHLYVWSVVVDNIDEAWWEMQADQWSPNGEACYLIKYLGLKHTSMSAGDVVEDEHGDFYEAIDSGWRKLEPKPLAQLLDEIGPDFRPAPWDYLTITFSESGAVTIEQGARGIILMPEESDLLGATLASRPDGEPTCPHCKHELFKAQDDLIGGC